MAAESTLATMTYPAAADLSTKQYYAVSGTQTSGVNIATTAKAMTGILQDKPSAAGRACSVAVRGRSKAMIRSNHNVSDGALLEVHSDGTLTTLASGVAVARAEEAVTGALGVSPIIAVTLLPSNDAFA